MAFSVWDHFFLQFSQGSETFNFPSLALAMLSGVGARNRPSNGLKGKRSGPLRFMWVANPRAKSYMMMFGMCFQESNMSAKSRGLSARMLHFMLYTMPHGHIITAQPPDMKKKKLFKQLKKTLMKTENNISIN